LPSSQHSYLAQHWYQKCPSGTPAREEWLSRYIVYECSS